MKNKNGYALIYVLGVVALMTFLVATLTRFTMQRVFSVNRNVYNTIDVAKAEMSINSASMELIDFFEFKILNTSEVAPLSDTLTEYTTRFNEISAQYNVTITPGFTNINEVNNSAKYTITSKVNKVTAERDFFISNVPSFLHFALGSRKDITLNGGMYIDGNVYSGQKLYISNQLNYVHSDQVPGSEISSKVEMNSKRNLYVKEGIYSCILTIGQTENLCYDIDDTNTDKSFFTKQNFNGPISETAIFDQSFQNDSPTPLTYNQRFLDVDIVKSFEYYLRETLSDKNPDSSIYIDSLDIPNLIAVIPTNNWLDTYENWLATHPDGTIVNFINTHDGSDSIFINQDVAITKSISFNKTVANENKWIIINGDLLIENKSTNAIEIGANILVTGNVNITGNIKINSILYALSETEEAGILGETVIDSATIRRYDDGSTGSNQFVLFSQGNIRFSKINSFNNQFSSFTYNRYTGEYTMNPDIEGFFYTNAHAELYAASSYIVIKGGVFARGDSSVPIPYTTDSYGMTLNAYRGKVYNDITSIVFDEIEFATEKSRLIIQHSQELLNNQPEGLPLNSEYNYIFSDIKIK